VGRFGPCELEGRLSRLSRILDVICDWCQALLGCGLVLAWWLVFYLLVFYLLEARR